MAILTAQDRAYVRRHARSHTIDPSETGSELNIVPFLDIVVNIIMFLLATTQTIMAIAQIDTNLPQTGPGRTTPHSLSATLVAGGVIVSSDSGTFASDCASRGGNGNITVGLRNGDYDWRALNACAVRLHSRPEFADLDDITLSADPQVSYQSMIHAMDALRTSDGRALFPDVRLSAGVR